MWLTPKLRGFDRRRMLRFQRAATCPLVQNPRPPASAGSDASPPKQGPGWNSVLHGGELVPSTAIAWDNPAPWAPPIHTWQTANPRFAKYCWWYSSATWKAVADSIAVAIGLAKCALCSSRSLDASAASRCSSLS